ncbi:MULTISPECIES: hypothetical protein [unclassified Streptomyces]|uniref:hypothetical protein n=1 Tax=unclassified Streptomyces TaxID=2593676 RepID=UPI0033AABB35
MFEKQIVAKVNHFPEFGRAASAGMIIAEIDKETQIIGEKVRRGLTATFTVKRRHGGETLTFFVSRLIGERRWCTDAVWTTGTDGRLMTARRNRPFGDRDAEQPLNPMFAAVLNKAAAKNLWFIDPKKIETGMRLEFRDNSHELEELTGELGKADEFNDFAEMDAQADEAAKAEGTDEEPKPAPEPRKLPAVAEPVFLF